MLAYGAAITGATTAILRFVTDETEIPPESLQPPSGSLPESPVETAAQVLPVAALSPADFERLAVRLARLEGTPVRSRRYGVPGQKKYGIDVYSRLQSGRYVTYQLKRLLASACIAPLHTCYASRPALRPAGRSGSLGVWPDDDHAMSRLHESRTRRGTAGSATRNEREQDWRLPLGVASDRRQRGPDPKPPDL